MTALRSLRSRSISARRSRPFKLRLGAFMLFPSDGSASALRLPFASHILDPTRSVHLRWIAASRFVGNLRPSRHLDPRGTHRPREPPFPCLLAPHPPPPPHPP